MADPATTSAIVKAISAAGDEQRKAEVEKNISGLVIRMLGPAADEIGAALGRYFEFRLHNVGRVMRKAPQNPEERVAVSRIHESPRLFLNKVPIVTMN